MKLTIIHGEVHGVIASGEFGELVIPILVGLDRPSRINYTGYYSRNTLRRPLIG